MTEYEEFESPEELLKTKQREREVRKGRKKQSFYLRVQKYLLILTVRFLEFFLQAEDFIL